jgi:hypothetical protein
VISGKNISEHHAIYALYNIVLVAYLTEKVISTILGIDIIIPRAYPF